MKSFREAKALHLKLGRTGERIALRLLRLRNCQRLAADWRAGTQFERFGELDLVVLDGETVVFVEVKTRRQSDRYAPGVNLSEYQKKRIWRGARRYCEKHHIPETMEKRFDLVEVIHDGRRLRDIALHEGYMSWEHPASNSANFFHSYPISKKC